MRAVPAAGIHSPGEASAGFDSGSGFGSDSDSDSGSGSGFGTGAGTGTKVASLFRSRSSRAPWKAKSVHRRPGSCD